MTRPATLTGDNAAPLRVLLAASAGGHWIELCRLENAFHGCDCQFVSTAGGMTAPVGNRPVFSVQDSSRDSLVTLLHTTAALWKIMRDFRPDVVISTGAAPGAVALLLGKLIGARTIWIDSIANSDELSLSGKAVRLVADVWLTQWPELANGNGKLAYLGQVL